MTDKRDDCSCQLAEFDLLPGPSLALWCVIAGDSGLMFILFIPKKNLELLLIPEPQEVKSETRVPNREFSADVFWLLSYTRQTASDKSKAGASHRSPGGSSHMTNPQQGLGRTGEEPITLAQTLMMAPCLSYHALMKQHVKRNLFLPLFFVFFFFVSFVI